jgi:predicted Fe-Mo cluster-binding NifX family protein
MYRWRELARRRAASGAEAPINTTKESSMNTVIAIPSSHPGGLEAELGAHFGHCDLYTLIRVVDGQVQAVQVIPTVPHQQGGCMAPVQYLAAQGATTLIAGGMGLRPLMGFQQMGITVYHGGSAQSVGDALQALLGGELQQFSAQHTCGGGGAALMEGR